MESLQFSMFGIALSLITSNLSWIFGFKYLGIGSMVVFAISLFVLGFYYRTLDVLYDTERSWRGFLAFTLRLGGIYGFMISTTNMAEFLSTNNWWNFSLQVFWVMAALFIVIATILHIFNDKREANHM